MEGLTELEGLCEAEGDTEALGLIEALGDTEGETEALAEPVDPYSTHAQTAPTIISKLSSAVSFIPTIIESRVV